MKATPPRKPKGTQVHGFPRGSGKVGPDPWEARLAGLWRSLRGAPGSGLLTEWELDTASKELLALQRGLTGERTLVGASYMDEVERLGAYLLYYWPVSRAQVLGMLGMAYPAGPGGDFFSRPLRILDLGAGPGPCGIAASEWAVSWGAGTGVSSRDVAILACDQSAAALGCGARLAKAVGFRYKTVPSWRAGIDPIPEGPFDLVVLGHLINELYPGKPDRGERRLGFLREAAARLTPAGLLLVLEPATLLAGRDMLELRDRMVAEGRQVLAPCFRNGPCPAFAQEGQTCHSDFSWTAGPQFRALKSRAALDKDVVKTTAIVFGRQADGPGFPNSHSSENARPYRVVSEPMLNKAGRIRLLLCGEDGRFPFSAKPGEGYPGEGVFRGLKRSDGILLDNPAPRESGWTLGVDTIIRRI